MLSSARTLDGLNVGDFDEITVNDGLTVRGTAALNGMSLDGSLSAADIETTGDITCDNVSAETTVSGATGSPFGNRNRFRG